MNDRCCVKYDSGYFCCLTKIITEKLFSFRLFSYLCDIK